MHECVQLHAAAAVPLLLPASERASEHKGVADNLVQIYHSETIPLFMFSNLILIRFRI